MDLHSHPQGDQGRFEQILNQFLLKSLHIILDSRAPANRKSSRGGEVKNSDKWFNLALGERPTAMDGLSFCNRSSMEPMIIDIILVQGSTHSSSGRDSHTTLASGMSMETVLERWVVQYEYQRSSAPQAGDASYKKIYKKSIVLLRSVYSMLRLLPAYKAFRKLCSLRRNCDFDVNYKVCSFAAPFSRSQEESMKKYSFVPIDTHQGRLSVSVTYCKDLSDFNLEAFVSCPPDIIMDYVGSPLTEPMRKLPSTSSEKCARATSFPIRGKQPASSSPFQRRHSWTSGLHGDVSSQENQPFSGSPPLHRSPYEYSSPPTDLYINRTRSQKLPAYHRAASAELLSPPFISSPSPSPPTYFSGGNPVQGHRRSETAPMSIPHPMLATSTRYLSPNSSDPNRHSLPPPSPRHSRYDPSSHESSPGNRSIRRSGSHRDGESSPGLSNVRQKVVRDAKEDSGRFSSLLSSCSSPCVGIWRSSPRLSFQDDFGDCDFSCPFIVDDVDPPDDQASLHYDGRNSSDISSRSSSAVKKSQDAAVGALVHMLRTAPPLQQDCSYYTSQSSGIQVDRGVGSASECFKPRKTSDALEELKVYKEMKNLLLSRSIGRMAT